MTVTNLWSGLRMYSAFQSNNDSDTTETFAVASPGMQEMLDIAALNSHVKFDKTDIPFEQRRILGDATETGLIRFAGKHIADYDAYQKQFPKVFEIPFNSSNKWALVIVRIVYESLSGRHRILTEELARQTTCSRSLDPVHQGGS